MAQTAGVDNSLHPCPIRFETPIRWAESQSPVGFSGQNHPDGHEDDVKVEQRVHVAGIIEIVEHGVREDRSLFPDGIDFP